MNVVFIGVLNLTKKKTAIGGLFWSALRRSYFLGKSRGG